MQERRNTGLGAQRLLQKQLSRGSIGLPPTQNNHSELGIKKSQPRFKFVGSIVEGTPIAEEAIPHTARAKPTVS